MSYFEILNSFSINIVCVGKIKCKLNQNDKIQMNMIFIPMKLLYFSVLYAHVLKLHISLSLSPNLIL